MLQFTVESNHALSQASTRRTVLWEMQIDLIAVVIRVVRCTVRVVQPDHLRLVEHAHLVRHHRRLVERRLPIHDDKVAVLEVAVDALLEAIVCHDQERKQLM